MDLTVIKGFLEKSMGRIIIVIVILLLTIITQKIVKKLMEKFLIKSTDVLKVDKTQYNFLKHVISALIFIVGIAIAIYFIPPLRALSISVLAGAGILAVMIGFASQAAFSNIISGVFIAIFKPFRVDDRITIGTGLTGFVEDITLRHTVIRNFENKRIIVPNSVMSNEIIENSNLVEDKICRLVNFGISYDSDINKAIKIMQDEAMKHRYFIDNRTGQEKKEKIPPVVVRLMDFGDSSVNLRAWVWTPDPISAFKLGTDLNKSIKERFDKEGIEIPFPYRTIVYKKDQNKR